MKRKKHGGQFLSKDKMFRRVGARKRTTNDVLARARKAGLQVHKGSFVLMLESPGAHVFFNPTSGMFWGKTPTNVQFHSSNRDHDAQPWMQKLLHFFWIEGPKP